MQREQFHELLTRVSQICGRGKFVVFGSQSVHALTDSPPAEVLVSVECDLWLREEPEVAARLAVELGKDSAFAQAMGVYADPLPPDLPIWILGWRQLTLCCRDGAIRGRGDCCLRSLLVVWLMKLFCVAV